MLHADTSCPPKFPNKRYHEHLTRTQVWPSTIVKFWQTNFCNKLC